MEVFIFSLVLSGAVVVFEDTPNSRDAAVNSLRAGYYQSEYNKVIEPLVKELESKYVSDRLRKVGIGASFIYRLVEDRRIEYSWGF
jgi:hypothetical protein